MCLGLELVSTMRKNVEKKWILAVIVALIGAATGSSPIYKYVGCYYDAVGAGRDLNGRDLTMSSLTINACANQCQSAGYPYAGMQIVNQCFCGASFGYLGPSTDCNTTCNGVYCGGYLSNDVYYAVDYSTMSQRELVFHSQAATFEDARAVCVSNGGDLPTVDSNTVSSSIASIMSQNGSDVGSVWIGLRQRLTAGPYEWTDEATPVPYVAQSYLFKSFWVPSDTQQNPCVEMNLPSQKWQSVTCATTLPFVCLQLPPPAVVPDNDETTVVSPTTAPDNTQMLALYIVLPLFAFCYGGSCIFYCIHKIYQNCVAKKRHAKMTLDSVEIADPVLNPIRPPVPRVAVYQAPPMMPAPVQAMPLPTKDPLAAAFYGTAPMKPAYQYQPTINTINDMPPMTKANFPPQPGFGIPPQEDRRARQLQNAAAEARGRRPPKEEVQKTNENVKANDDVQAKSTANLLEKDDEIPDMSTMSIKQILQLKMSQKTDKKKKRGIIST